MSNYLSRIASRNLPDQPATLMAAAPLAKEIEADPFQQDVHEQAMINPLHQANSLLQNNFSPQQIIEQGEHLPAPVAGKESKKNVEKALVSKSPPVKYITKYIERLHFNENKEQPEPVTAANSYKSVIKSKTDTDPIKSHNTGAAEVWTNKSTKTPKQDHIIDEEKGKIQPVNIIFSNRERKPIGAREKPLVKPSFKYEKFKTSNTVSNNPPVTRLNPVQTQVDTNGKSSRLTPKLVIGKITVEVAQPEKPSSPRIINRVVHAPSVSGNAKINKLSFGLGQL